MHYSPDGRSLVFTAGLGSDPPVRVVIRDESGQQHIAMIGARAPWWLENGVVQAVGPDSAGNVLQRATAPFWSSAGTQLHGGNQHTAAAGKWAVARTDPRRILTSWGETYDNGANPALSPDGRWFSWTWVGGADDGSNALRVDDLETRTGREVAHGDPIDARFGWGSTALTWVDDGRVFGIAGVGNQTDARIDELTYRGFRCGWPRALWDGERLWIAMAADLGNSSRIILAEWGAAARGEHSGFVVADSTGSGFDMAVAA